MTQTTLHECRDSHQPMFVVLGAYETEPSRVERLAKLCAALFERRHGVARGEIESISRLWDYKGELTVTSRAPLPHRVQRFIREAWAFIGNEPAENVTFVVGEETV
jgi:hypothetical protein